MAAYILMTYIKPNILTIYRIEWVFSPFRSCQCAECEKQQLHFSRPIDTLAQPHSAPRTHESHIQLNWMRLIQMIGGNEWIVILEIYSINKWGLFALLPPSPAPTPCGIPFSFSEECFSSHSIFACIFMHIALRSLAIPLGLLGWCRFSARARLLSRESLSNIALKRSHICYFIRKEKIAAVRMNSFRWY